MTLGQLVSFPKDLLRFFETHKVERNRKKHLWKQLHFVLSLVHFKATI